MCWKMVRILNNKTYQLSYVSGETLYGSTLWGSNDLRHFPSKTANKRGKFVLSVYCLSFQFQYTHSKTAKSCEKNLYVG